MLGVSVDATAEEIQQAYYKKVDAEHERIAYIQQCAYQPEHRSELIKKTFQDDQGNPVTVVIRGIVENQYIPATVDYGDSSKEYYQDEFGRIYVNKHVTTIDESGKNMIQNIVPHQQAIKNIRQAYEQVTGQKVETIVDSAQQLDIRGLDQQRIYDYVSQPTAHYHGLLAIIQDERKKNGIEDFIIVDGSIDADIFKEFMEK